LSGTIPLIRAGSAAPFIGWMRKNGFAVEALLQASDLASFDLGNPDQPVPLLFLFRFAWVILPVLVGRDRRTHAAIFSFMAGVTPPMPMLGRSLL
jgi:hypothetical protein